MLTAAAAAARLAALQCDGHAWVAVAWPCALPTDAVEQWSTLPRGERTLLAVNGGWLLAQGQVWKVEADGPGRTAWLARAQAQLEARTVVHHAEGAPALPLVLTAYAFEDSHTGPSHWGHQVPSARMWLPRRWWWRGADGQCWAGAALAVNALSIPADLLAELSADAPCVAPAAPAPWPRLTTDYAEQVAEAVDLINDGVMRKVVLARAVDEACHADEATVLRRLISSAGSGTTVYGHDLDDGGLFCGATPEVLVECHGDRLQTMALAGSCPRGQHEAEDLAALADMLSSTKQRKEHGLVVEHVVSVLRQRCRPFSLAPTPHQRAEGALLHLETLVEADLIRRDYLEVIGALHPTPAVCGLPTATAAHYIRRHERLHRGLYAGAIGWIGPADCRLIVPLRGGILSANRATARLFAGAGIVETSDPQAELAETELKFAPMRRAIAAQLP